MRPSGSRPQRLAWILPKKLPKSWCRIFAKCGCSSLMAHSWSRPVLHVEPVQLQVVCQRLWENHQTQWEELPPPKGKLPSRILRNSVMLTPPWPNITLTRWPRWPGIPICRNGSCGNGLTVVLSPPGGYGGRSCSAKRSWLKKPSILWWTRILSGVTSDTGPPGLNWPTTASSSRCVKITRFGLGKICSPSSGRRIYGKKWARRQTGLS